MFLAEMTPTTVIDRLFAACGFRGPLTRSDRRRWAAARTLQDLCDLTVMWLAGDIASQPGYYGPVDVDEDDAPGLTTVLKKLNRSGYLTNGSQAGFDGTGYDGAYWQQHAAVTGFAEPDTVVWLRWAVRDTPFKLIAHPPKTSRWGRGEPGAFVTLREGVAFTQFGQQLDVTTIADEIYDGVGDDALNAVCAAIQVTIYDPQPGRNDLWPVLYAATLGQRARCTP